jgi:DNA-binding LacI/PurR family transcriptional regulator
VSGINARLSRSDYVLNLFIASDDPGDKTTSYVRSGAVDGAIVVSHHTSDTFIDRIASSVPVVYGGRPVRERERDYYVDVDNVRGGKDATTYLIERGHHRIATITGPLTMPAGVDRLQGYRDALAAHSLAEGSIEDGNFTADGGAAAMRRILDSIERPDAIFVSSDLMARGALAVLAREGIRVPDDIAIIGFDDSPVATSVTPQLTTMRQPSFAQGERMASVLLDLLAGRHPRHVTILETELVVRDSV